MRTSKIALIAVLTALFATGRTRGAEDKPTLKPPFDMRDVIRLEIAWNRRTIVQAYRDVGVHDAKWDDAALAFLEHVSVFRAYGSKNVIYFDRTVSTLAQIQAEGQRVVESGCTDPMVLYQYAVSLADWDRAAEAKTLFERLGPDMLTSSYPAVRKYFAAKRLAGGVAPKSVERESTLLAMESAIKHMFTDGSFEFPRERQVFMNVMQAEFEDPLPAIRDYRYKVLSEAEDVDLWVLGTIGGIVELSRADWANSGSFDAPDVQIHVQAAKAHLQTALDADETLPLPFATMMGVALASSGGTKEATEWYQKASRVQPDDPNTLRRMRLCLTPAWGGSQRALLDNGRDLTRNSDPATAASLEYLAAVRECRTLATEAASSLTEEPEIYDNAMSALQRAVSLARKRGADSKLVARAFVDEQFAYAWRFGHWDDAARFADEAGPKPSQVMFEPWHGFVDEAMSEVRARTGASGSALAKLPPYNPATAADQLPALKAVLDTMKPADPGRLYVSTRVREAQVAADLAAGKEVDLPSDPLAPDWRITGGTWQVEEGALVGAPLNDGFNIVFRPRLPRSYNFSCKVEILESGPKSYDTSAGCSPVWGFNQHQYRVNFYEGEHALLLEKTARLVNRKSYQPTRTFEFECAVRGGEMEIKLNGEHMFSESTALVVDDERRVGVGGPFRTRGRAGTFRFTNMKLKAAR